VRQDLCSSRRASTLAVLSDAFFYGYVATLIGAGASGALFAKIDLALISGFRPQEELPRVTAANVLSQHRFLRAIELGFGLFALRFHKEIKSVRAYNGLFLSVMMLGVGARALGRAADGRPRASAYAFAGSELVGAGLIFAHTRSTLRE
jgi:hypothetical protein